MRSKSLLRGSVLLAAWVALGVSGCKHECTCLHDHGDGGHNEAGPREIEVEIGTVGGPAKLDFVPLEPGGDIPLQTFGQGGTHVTVAIRARGLGTNVAYFDVSVENALTGAVVMTVPTRKPQLWLCNDGFEICDYLPVRIMTGGLAPIGPIENRDGLRVIVSAVVRDEEGRSGSGSEEGVLRWMPPPTRDAGVRDAGDEDGGVDFDSGSE